VGLKPSEFTPHTSQVMQEIVDTVFEPKEVALLQGGVALSTALLKLPFHHVFFTGSPKVGKLVMKAAAENLSSITLELGGKSPTIVDASANLKRAAKRIAWAKFLNAGQICIAPDYLFIEASVKDEFLSLLQYQIERFYGSDASSSSQYCSIVNQAHHQRLVRAIDDARSKGAHLIYGGATADENRLSPTLMESVDQQAQLMSEEIFGPILPIKSFNRMQEVIDFINRDHRPLALYIYSKKKEVIKKVIQQTRAGSSCINNSIIQYSNHHLPFGGVNNSGIGKSHGIYGFQSFSNARSMMRQYTLGPIDFVMPPYTKLKEKMIQWTVKWL